MSALPTLLALVLAAASSRERLPPTAPPPAAPAGSQLAPLSEDAASPWRFALATGVTGRFGGRQISAREDNKPVLLYFGGQADGSWPEGHGQVVRLRFRLFTGGESDIYVPSDGDAELAWSMGSREFRFVLARFEVARELGLGLQTLAQAGTLPCFEGTFSFLGNQELSYFVSAVEAAWVRYHGAAHLAHLPGWTTEDDRPATASAGRLRYTVLLPASVAVSLQGDLMKYWDKADLLVALEGAVGYQLPRQQAAFHAGVRWTSYTRRGLARYSTETDGEVLAIASASLSF